MLDRIDARGAPAVANLTFGLMHHFFSWCRKKRQGYLMVSPMDGFETPHPKGERTRILSDDEIVRVWRASYQLNFPFGHIIRMLSITGQRRGEVEQMKRSDISDDGIWTISAAIAKNKTEHRVPLSPLALEVLADAPVLSDSDLIFASRRTGRRVNGWSFTKKHIDRIIVEDGGEPVKEWVWHDLRRTTASGMQQIKVPREVIEAVLNHKGGKSGIVGVYQRYDYDNEKRHALNVWADHLTGLIDGMPRSNVVPLCG